MGANLTELSDEQKAIVVQLVEAMQSMAVAFEALDAVGLDLPTALRSIPGPDGNGSAYDAMPLTMRLMLG